MHKITENELKMYPMFSLSGLDSLFPSTSMKKKKKKKKKKMMMMMVASFILDIDMEKNIQQHTIRAIIQ